MVTGKNPHFYIIAGPNGSGSRVCSKRINFRDITLCTEMTKSLINTIAIIPGNRIL